MQSVDRATSSTNAQCKLSFMSPCCRSVYSGTGLLAGHICQDKSFGWINI